MLNFLAKLTIKQILNSDQFYIKLRLLLILNTCKSHKLNSSEFLKFYFPRQFLGEFRVNFLLLSLRKPTFRKIFSLLSKKIMFTEKHLA